MVVSNYELNNTMDDDFSQLFCTESPLNLGICPPAMMGRSSEQHKFEPAILSGIISTHPLESPPSALHATESYMGFDQNEHRVGNSPASCSQFPASDLHIVLCKSSGYNFFTAERAGSYFDFRDTLQSLGKSQLGIDQSNSSSEKSNEIPCNNMSKLSSHDKNMLLADQNITLVRRELPVPSDSNQALNVISYLSFLFLFFPNMHNYMSMFWELFGFWLSFTNRFVTVHTRHLPQKNSESDGLKIFTRSSSRAWISLVALRVSNFDITCRDLENIPVIYWLFIHSLIKNHRGNT